MPLRHRLRAAAFAAAFMIAFLRPLLTMGQSDPLYTQAWALPTLYNPAAAGSTDWLRIRGAARLQWVGIDNAPKSFTAAADIPFKLLNRRWGGGVNVTQEGIGLFSNTYVNGQLSGRLKKLFGGELTIGVQVGYFGSSFRGSDVYIPDDDDYHDSNDPAIPTQDVGGGTVDFGIGLQYIHPKFHVGVSMLHPAAPKVKLNTKGTTSSSATSDNHEFETYVNRVLYLTGGSNIQVKNTLIELQPDLIVASDLKTFSGVLSLKGWYNRMFFAGVAYRWDDAVSINLGAEFKNFLLGYAYDIPTSRILKASSGSHELTIGYRLKLDFSGKNRHRHRSIRLM
ncbi:MAG: type IX secretion system membrane protein PorP/SprF [Muribaculaceae bacterium]|nr:type IX secretion system membrane protein PorP/SprF [Bacteroides sp.]MDE6194362.1 type IX secretion system membrane protein PorP/SprF [Muribaculaceae bacterium]